MCEVRKNEREKEKEIEGVDERVCVYAMRERERVYFLMHENSRQVDISSP